ncbi:MAG: hypothetical protein IJA62_03940 [Ruminococcus sp.]|nr:hypothetical protein [Ruminococcus sp.]
METYNNNEYSVFGTVARQMEEIADSLEKNILKDAAEDQALIMQADDSENGALLCEKYQKVLERISKTKEELVCNIDKIRSFKQGFGE